jgi:hypothetical protein
MKVGVLEGQDLSIQGCLGCDEISAGYVTMFMGGPIANTRGQILEFGDDVHLSLEFNRNWGVNKSKCRKDGNQDGMHGVTPKLKPRWDLHRMREWTF